MVVSCMRRNARWASAEEGQQDPLLQAFGALKQTLAGVSDLKDIEVDVFLGPFLDVVRSEVVGPITGVALSSINKFLAYGLIDLSSPHAASGIESIADAVTHTKFMGTDLASDEVVLMKILQVLRTILLTPVGACMSNEAVCELMQTCFKICFEMRLSELLRRCAEQTLTDMIHLLFSRLAVLAVPDKNDIANSPVKNSLSRMSDVPRTPAAAVASSDGADGDGGEGGTADTPATPATPATPSTPAPSAAAPEECAASTSPPPLTSTPSGLGSDEQGQGAAEERTNRFGVRFTPREAPSSGTVDGDGKQVSYGIPCIRELFRFIISLINPRDRHNNETMIGMGLSLLTVAMETGGAHMSRFVSLKEYLEDDMCHNLFELLQTENLTLYAATLRVIFLTFEVRPYPFFFLFFSSFFFSFPLSLSFVCCVLFLFLFLYYYLHSTPVYSSFHADVCNSTTRTFLKALRDPLKFQLERFVTIVCEMDFEQHSVEHKEGALDTLLQLCRVPSFLIDLYLNFDCNLHCSNLFEKLVAFLSQNAFPEDRVLATHLNALDSLLSVVQEISGREDVGGGVDAATAAVAAAMVTPTKDVGGEALGDPALCTNGMVAASPSPSVAELKECKRKKALLATAVEMFNESSSKGLKFLTEHGFMSNPPEWPEVASFLRETPGLSKAEIGEFIGKRKNKPVLAPYVQLFDVTNQPIDHALRQFLEAFRLPGEAPVISNILEDFANSWFDSYSGTKVPKDPDAAFILCYAIMQLNTDQHNPTVKDKMTFKQFVKNERGLNSGDNYPKEFLQDIFTAIRDTEIVMPSEQKGELKAEYEWKLVLNRARDPKKNTGVIYKCNGSAEYDQEMFSLIWKPTITALHQVLDTATDEVIIESILDSLGKCATICARFELCEVFDNLIIALCKRTLLTTQPPTEAESEGEQAAVGFTSNPKAHHVAKLAFKLCREHGSIMRHGWANIMDVVLNLFNARLLPEEMTTVSGFLQDEWSLLPDEKQEQTRANDSWFPFWGAAVEEKNDGDTEQARATAEARDVVRACAVQEMFAESAYLQEASLKELFKSLMLLSRSPAAHTALGLDIATYDENACIFFLEQVYEVAKANKDRIEVLWETLLAHLHALAVGAEDRARLASRALVCLIRLGERLYKTDKLDQKVLDSFAIFEQLPEGLKVDNVVRAQIVAGLASFVKANASLLGRRGWELFMAALQGATHDQLANECAVEALHFVAESALTPENAGLCQVTAVGYVDLAIESTLAAVLSGGALDDSAAPPEPLAAKVLNVLHALHVAIPKVYRDQAADASSLWTAHWESILQAMSKFCTVAHRPVRQQALTLLQSSLMLPDLDRLSAAEWKMCLEKVLFPLLSALLTPPAKSASVAALEEIRVRSVALLSKVFLQHLSVLISLENFVDVWLSMLGYLERYMHAGTELAEAVPESLKNMLLVMSTAGILQPDGQVVATTPQTQTYVNGLWSLTYTRLEEFLPGLFHEVLPGQSASAGAVAAVPSAAAAAPAAAAAGSLPVPAGSPAMGVAPFTSPAAVRIGAADTGASSATVGGPVVAGSAAALQLPHDGIMSPIVLGSIPSFSPAGMTPNIGTMFASSQPFQMASPAAGTPIRLTEAYPEMFSTPGTMPSPASTPNTGVDPSTPVAANTAPIQLHSTPQLSKIGQP